MAAVLDRQELHAVWDQILKTVRRTDTDPWLSPGFMVALRAAETIGHYVTGEFFFLGYRNHHISTTITTSAVAF